MKRSVPAIYCPCCEGQGTIAMPDCYAETLRLLYAQKGPVNAAALAKLAGINGSAMANRLVWLEGQGLAVGRRNGRERLWRATK